MEEERKRKSTGSPTLPLKKMHLHQRTHSLEEIIPVVDTSDNVNLKNEENNTANSSTEDENISHFNLALFQKQAIFSRMQEYKIRWQDQTIALAEEKRLREKIENEFTEMKLEWQKTQTLLNHILHEPLISLKDLNRLCDYWIQEKKLPLKDWKNISSALKVVPVDREYSSISLEQKLDEMTERFFAARKQLDKMLFEKEQKAEPTPAPTAPLVVSPVVAPDQQLDNEEYKLEIEHLKQVNSALVTEANSYKNESVSLKSQVSHLQEQLTNLPDQVIYEHPLFKRIEGDGSFYAEDNERLRRENDRLRREIEDEQEKRIKGLKQFESDREKELTDQINDLKTQLDDAISESLKTQENLKIKEHQLEQLQVLVDNYRNSEEIFKRKVNIFSQEEMRREQANRVFKSATEKELAAAFEQSENDLMVELEEIAKGYEDLQSQLSTALAVVEEKDKIVLRFLSEKIRIDQQRSQVQKDAESNQQAIVQLKKAEQQFLNTRRLSEHKERQLMLNVASVEKDLSLRTHQLETLKRKSSEENYKGNEAISRVERLGHRVSELQNALRDSLVAKEDALFDSRRLTEENRILRRKLDIRKGKSSMNTNDFDELEAYKKLLQCNSCELRQKNVVLLRCMHLFCKECVDARLDTRQRKCPNCSEPFGIQDVKQVYL